MIMTDYTMFQTGGNGMQTIQEPQALVLLPEITTLTASNAKEFKASLEGHLENTKTMVIELSSVTFIDSTGLGVLLFALKRLNQKQGELKLCNVTKPVRVLFELVRLHQIMEVYNSREEALASFSV
jgi:anti-sigma B factor antagonist